MEKDNLCILLSGNEKIAFALANVIIGLKRYNEDLISKIIIYNELSIKTKK